MKIYGKFKDRRKKTSGMLAREKALHLKTKLKLEGKQVCVTREFIDDLYTPWYFVKGE